MLKINSRNTRTRCEISSELTIKTPERRQSHRSGIFIVNFEHISQLVLVFLLLTLNMQLPTGLFVLTRLYIYYYIICMTVPLSVIEEKYGTHFLFKLIPLKIVQLSKIS